MNSRRRFVTFTAPDLTIRLPAPEYIIETETVRPPNTPKHEQKFLDAWKRLCGNRDFRSDIKGLQQKYPPGYWRDHSGYLQKSLAVAEELRREVEKIADAFYQRSDPEYRVSINLLPAVELSFDCDSKAISQKWAVSDVRWIEWLVRNWDVTKPSMPPFGPQDRGLLLDRWRVEFDYYVPYIGNTIIREARIVLRAPVSLSAAITAAETALRKLNAGEKVRKGRPGITDVDRANLRTIFERHGIPRPQERLKLIRKARSAMASLGRDISETTIGNELRRWLRTKGQPIKTYTKGQ